MHNHPWNKNLNKRTNKKINKIAKKISKTMKGRLKIKREKRKCKKCFVSFICKITDKKKYCKKCSCSINGKIGGLKSVIKQNRRSKNEIYFAELCKKHWKQILENKAIFNGWDADIIIPKIKIAVLWNGKWHYQKITSKHSVKQVQNRDNIKKKEIKKMKYKVYVIKDMGKYNKKFVENEFEKFLRYLDRFKSYPSSQ